MQILDDLRARGWTVAVHNDYRIHGEACTFWLLTHPNGRYVIGEASTDELALTRCRDLIDRYSYEKPPTDVNRSRHGDTVTLQFIDEDHAGKFWKWLAKATA